MKRLVKKSSMDYNIFFKTLILDNIYSQDDIMQVINENKDCLYDGNAFRIFFFHTNEVKNAKEKYLKESGLERVDDIFDTLWGVLDNLIKVNGEYQSFSKTKEGISEVDNHQRDGHEFGITISVNVINALDIKKLYDKYEDGLDNEAKDGFSYFKNQDEVLAKLDTTDFNYEGGFDMSQLRSL